MRTMGLVLLLTLAGCLDPAGDLATAPAPALHADCAGATLAPPDMPCVRALPGGSGRQTEASLAVHPTDPLTVLVSWTEWRPSQIWAGITHDGGRTWTTTALHDPSLQALPGGNRYSYDSQAAFLPDGTAVVLYGGENVDYSQGPTYVPDDARMTVARSTDGGATWRYRSFNEGAGLAVNPDFMPLAVAPDSGRMLVAAQAFSPSPAVLAGPFPIAAMEPEGIWTWSSDDGGTTWSDAQPLRLPLRDGEEYTPRLAMGPKGLAVLTVGHSPDASLAGLDEGGTLVALVSHDGGRSWDAPHELARSPLWFGLGPPVIHADGRLEVVLESDKEILRTESRDGGVTWSKPARVATTDDDLFFWQIGAAAPDGGLAVLAQTDNVCDKEQRDAPRWGVHLYLAPPEGEATHARMAASNASRVMRGCTAGNDYAGLAFGADGALWSAWADPRVTDTPRIVVARLAS